MKIGVAKEIKQDEYRVALTPAGALELINAGHEVTVEAGAGVGSAFPDDAYQRVGVRIVSVDDVWERSDLVLTRPAALDLTERADLLVALDDAIRQLVEIDERLAQVVEYRFFVGLTEPETADLLGVTSRTVARDWVRARGWLLRHLH